MEAKGKVGFAKADHEEGLSAPPGFVSLTAFTLKRSESKGVGQHVNSKAWRASKPALPPNSASSRLEDSEMVKKNLQLKKRPWIVYKQINDDADRSVPKEADMDCASNARLPKGVVRGCPKCSKCQKITARWDPEKARRIVLEEAPSVHPGEEEFGNTFEYIGSIRKQVEPYGLCRIVPPPSWKPPSVKDSHIWKTSTFFSHVQRVHELQHCCSMKKSSPSDNIKGTKRKRGSTDLDNELGDVRFRNLNEVICDGAKEMESELGPEFSLQSFNNYADYFKVNYFSTKSSLKSSGLSGSSTPQEQREVSEEDIEGEYWRIVEKPTDEIEVLCGSSLNARQFGSGFPVSSSTETSTSAEYLESGWNLNITSRLPGSLLAFEKSDVPGILSPHLHVGMCFSTLPWKVEDHQLYALYYHHLGVPRIWYGVPGEYSYKFNTVMKKYFPEISERYTHLLNKRVMQLSPTTLTSEGLPVYRCVQRSGEFVLFLPGVYYAGFDCGFNCLESANFAPLDWLPHGQNVVELYREQRRKTSLSYDKLLLSAANEVVETQWEILLKGKRASKHPRWKDTCGKGGLLARTLGMRVKSEVRQREHLSASSQSRKMDKQFDATGKKECITCYCDVYLSAVTCPCNPIRYSCLLHSRNLSCCAWSDKIFLFRYEISELDVLADAVEGRYSAIRRWIKEDLGFALHLNHPHVHPSRPSGVPSVLNGSSAGDNHDAKSTITPGDEVKVDAIEKLLHEAKRNILEESSFWDQPAEHVKQDTDTAVPGGTGEVDTIEKLLADAKKRILEEDPLEDAKGKGVILEGLLSASDSSDDVVSSSSSLNSDEQVRSWLEKSGFSSDNKRESRSKNGAAEDAEVDSSASSRCNSLTEKQRRLKSLPGKKRYTVGLGDEEDGYRG
ncbi:hypothetical protein Droror1_Dr00022235 [Drosera rotundifolia]